MGPCTGNLSFFREVVDHDAIGQTVGCLTGVVVDHLVGDLNFEFAEVDFAIGLDTRTTGPGALSGYLLNQGNHILRLFLQKSVEGFRLGRILPVAETNCHGEDHLTVLGVDAHEQSRIFTTAGEVIGAKLSFHLATVASGKSTLNHADRQVTRPPLDVEFAVLGSFDASCTGFQDRTEEAEVHAIARLDEEGVLIEREFFTCQVLEDGVEVFAESFRKVCVRQRGVLRGVFTATQRSELGSVGAQVNGRDVESCRHFVFSF